MFRNVAFSLAVIGVSLAIGGPARAAVIDDFSVDDLANYTNTVILANGGSVNTATWQMGGGSLTFDTSTYLNINQNALTRNGLSLNVGEEVQLRVNTPLSGSQDIGLYVGTQPVFNNRAASDYVNVYGRSNGQVFNRGFSGGSELGLSGGDFPTFDTLFIARTAADAYEMGYYNGAARTVQNTRLGLTGNTATYVGLYNDVRAGGTLGTATQLSVVPEPTSLALAGVAVAAGMLNAVRRRR